MSVRRRRRGVLEKQKYGLYFDGADNYVSTEVNPQTDLQGGDFSFCLWFNTNVSTRSVIIGDADLSDRFYIRTESATTIRIGLSDASVVLTVTEIINNTWNHVALTFDYASGTVYLYLNGILQDTSTSVNYKNNIRNGSMNMSTASSNTFDGELDYLCVYNRRLSLSEIQKIYGKGDVKKSGVVKPGLIMGLKCEEGAGTTTYDFSGNNKNGTLQNGTSWVLL